MLIPREDSESAQDATTTRRSSTKTTTATTTTTSSKTLLYGAPISNSTFTTATVATTGYSSATEVTSAPSTSSISTSTSIDRGPARTASSVSITSSAGDTKATSTSSLDAATRRHSGMPQGSKDVTILVTILGGLFVLSLLAYALYRRRRGASFGEIMRFRHHPPSTILLSESPRQPRFTMFPIYRESRYSVRSSMHAISEASYSKGSGRRTHTPVPLSVARKFHYQNPYVKSTWKTPHPPSPGSPLVQSEYATAREGHTSRNLKDIEASMFTLDRLDKDSDCSEDDLKSPRDMMKSGVTIKFSEQPFSEDEDDGPSVDPPASLHPGGKLEDRWSWTNSQAPPTPRMYAPSTRSSISTLPRFRTINSWVRGQTERIAEEAPPMPLRAHPATLAPPPTTRKSGKRPKLAGDGLTTITSNPSSTKLRPPMSPNLARPRPTMQRKQSSR